jgi:integrase
MSTRLHCTTVGEFLNNWLYERKADLAPKTYVRYQSLLRHQVLPYIGGVPLRELSPTRLALLYRELSANGKADGRPLGSSSIGHVHRFLHSCLEAAIDQGLIENNPADRDILPRLGVRPILMQRSA